MIIDNYKEFLDKLFQKLSELGIDVSGFELDHISYQASSNEDYDKLKPEFMKLGEVVAEDLVGGRRVAIIKLKDTLLYKNYSISAVELIAPKEEQVCESMLEHVEFVIGESFESFMAKYPGLPWDTSATNQKTYSMLKLLLYDNVRVKFHHMNILEIVKNKS